MILSSHARFNYHKAKLKPGTILLGSGLAHQTLAEARLGYTHTKIALETNIINNQIVLTLNKLNILRLKLLDLFCSSKANLKLQVISNNLKILYVE